MRRWYLIAAFASVALAATFGPWLLSGGSAQDAAPPAAQPATKIAKSRIDKVVVYPNSALVTREVDVPDGSGLIELTVAPMPEQIVPSTMYSEGAENLRVLTTRFTTRVVAVDTSKDRRELEAELEKLQIAAAKINSDIGSIQKNNELLTRLESVTEKGHHSGGDVMAMAKYVMEQRAEKAKELNTALEQKRQNDVQMNFLQRKMAELGNGSGRMERDAILTVDRELGKGGKVRLNYLVGAVTWHPEYKLRAGKIDENVQLDYLANLKQSSGEDWNLVKLTLSTAQPMLNAAPPELCMLEPMLIVRGAPGGPPMPTAGFASPYAPSSPSMDLLSKAAQLRSDAAGNYRIGKKGEQKEAARQLNEASAYEQNLDLMRPRDEVLAQAKKLHVESSTTDGPSVTYHLPSKLSVPNRNDEQMVEVVKLSLAPKFYNKAVPVLNRHVYRLADIVNTSEHVLLPGEATMYQGTDFVGRMPMPLVASREEFTAGFGVDTQLQIQRQMVDQTRTEQGGNQVLKYEYRILISSYKNEPIKLQLWDRLPKAKNETSVGVSLVKSSPELSKDEIYVRESRPNNLLRWDLEVAANCNGAKALPITYEFRMELDRQMAITGFQSR